MKKFFSFRMLGALSIAALFNLTTQAQNTFPATGNVGIGTTTPAYPLHINTGYMGLQIDGNSTSWTGMYIKNTTATGQPFYGYQIPGKTAYHYLKPNGDWTLYVGGDRLNVNYSNGYVGLGVPSPLYRLHIASADTRAFQIDGSAAGYTGMYVNATNTSGLPFYGYITNGRSAWTYLDPSGNLKFYNSGDRLVILPSGNVLINKTTQTNSIYKLDVAGSVRANEVVVNTTGADFVFEDNYKLRPLEEVEAFINANNHLPEVPCAAEMSSEGMKVSELSTTLLQKVEELTLYMIELKKENATLKAKVEALENK
jgi:hypothetical protein